MQEQCLKRKCPSCNIELSYKTNSAFNRAEKAKSKCKRCSKKQISDSIIQKILELNEQGLLNRQIASILGINHRTVGSRLKAHNRQSIFANQPIDMVSETEAKCSKCKEIKSITNFQFGRKGQKFEYKFSYCNDCRRKQVYLNLNNDINKFLSNSFNKLKLRAKKKNIPFSITKKEFIEQYHSQNGLCFYTDVEMICEVGNNTQRNTMSVDKIIPQKGYCKGNVVFTTFRINTCKCDLELEEIEMWMPTWYNRIIDFLESKRDF